ncbi:SGNH/GDSL hydrolase family protein [soil metagenome]
MFAIALSFALAQTPMPADPFAKWEKEITAIEKKIATAKPGGIIFAGSSSIRLWDLKKSFPDWNAINVGFGGSMIPDSTHFYPKIIKPLKAKAIVFYAGDNDIGAKHTPERVRDDYAAFVQAVRADDKAVPIYYLPIKPSVKRWAMYDTQKKANALIQEVIKKDEHQHYVDLVPLLLGKDGQPDAALFRDDGLHLNDKGYAKWNEVLRTTIK